MKKRPYILVEWSCANKRDKSVGTLSTGRMVAHIASAKITHGARGEHLTIQLLWANA